MTSIETTRVEDVMTTALITVRETDRMDAVAGLFNEQDIHAAPVLSGDGKCVGIITSHDIVEYESVRQATQNELSHGDAFNIARYGSGMDLRSPGLHFEEVGYHMSKQIEPVSRDDPLSRVAKLMCSKHRHHVLVLDAEAKAIGMFSSLDLLSFLTGNPVCRTASCEADPGGP